MSSSNVVEFRSRPWSKLPVNECAALLDVLQAADFDLTVINAIARYTEVREKERQRAERKRYTDLKSDHRTRWTAGGRYPAEVVSRWREAAQISGRSMKRFIQDAAEKEAFSVLKKQESPR